MGKGGADDALMRGQHHREPTCPGLVITGFIDRDAHGDAGIVDEDVEAAEMRGHLADDGRDGVAVGDIEHPRFGRSASSGISRATASAASLVKSVTATLAPSAAKTRAVARPMPLAAPVTSTVSPFTDRLSSLKSDIGCSLT